MNILDIKNPKILKKMNVEELTHLSNDIRNFIIDSVSKKGGHLSSNLGIVDLTICLHKVFDLEKDRLFFDVSHQCYTHKILTGRAKDFNNLRSFNGLSGFSNINESIYDAYSSGHSGTSISTALGCAIARDNSNNKYEVIALIGDASITNGLSFEAINHLGSLNTKVIIILNDNEMSISKNVGALHNTLDKIRVNSNYNNIKDKTKSILNNIPLIGGYLYKINHYLKKSIKNLYNRNGVLFEELGLKYYGPINGHDYNEMLMYLDMAKKEKQSLILHVITEKGKGYEYALNDKVGTWHGVGKFDKETGKIVKSNNDLISWSEVISNILIKLTKKDKNIFVITPAMTGGSKLLKYANMFPNNFIDVGICEEHAMTLASGLALGGKIPFISIYSTFLQRTYDEIIHDIARMDLHVIIGVDRSGIVGEDGESHQGIYDLSFLNAIPNIIIACPKNSVEASHMLYTAIYHNKHPFIIRYSKNSIKYIEENYDKIINLGSWEYVDHGSDGTIISYGDFLENAISINKKLSDNNINLSIINARFIKPIDMVIIEELIKTNKPIFIYEEVVTRGSLGEELISVINNYDYMSKIYLYNIPDNYITHGKKEDIIKYLKLDVDSVYKDILVKYKGG